MRITRSTTLRFAALVFLLQLVGAAILLTTVHQLTRSQIAAQAQGQAAALRDGFLLAYREKGVSALAQLVSAKAAPGRVTGAVMLLVDRNGGFVAGNLAEWPPPLPQGTGSATLELYRLGSEKSERMRLIGTSLPGGERLLTGHVVESERRFTVVLREAMLSALVLAVAFAAFAAWSAARLIDRKLGVTVATTRAVSRGALDTRVPIDGGNDAFDALGAAINAMLDRIAALMSELKLATDGLAHDLRSPLMRLRATLERALSASEDGDARVAVGRAIDEADRLHGMLDTALRISRAEAGLGREAFVEVDLAEMIADLVEMYGPVAEDRGFAITAAAPIAIPGRVHRELLGQALANLIDNAMKYGTSRIIVSASSVGDMVTISVADDGPGIPEAQRPQALRRFGRLDAARSESGAGLGLSLAVAVARLHGGMLDLRDNGPGLRVVLSLPVLVRSPDIKED